MTNNIVKTNKFSKQELEEIAQLHIEGINKGFMTTLGKQFLEIFYDSIQVSKNGLLIAIYNNNDIIGYVSGVAGGKGLIYKSLILKHPYTLFFVLFKSIFSIKKMKRIFETILYSSLNTEKNNDIPSAELISLAVASQYRRKGFAKTLCFALEEEFYKLGHCTYKIMVGSSLADSQKFYESIGARKKKEMTVHAEESSRLYVKKIKC